MLLEIDFAGGDVYEFSRGIFDISLNAAVVPSVAPEFFNVRTAQQQRIDGSLSVAFLEVEGSVSENAN